MINVSDRIFRGPSPDHNELFNNKIGCALDLESGAQVFGDSEPLQEQLDGLKQAITVFCHPLGAILPPTINELKLGAAVLDRFSKSGIYVHCHHGVDRTGMICATYRILYQGWTPLRAAEEMLNLGFHKIYFYWIPQLWRLRWA